MGICWEKMLIKHGLKLSANQSSFSDRRRWNMLDLGQVSGVTAYDKKHLPSGRLRAGKINYFVGGLSSKPCLIRWYG